MSLPVVVLSPLAQEPRDGAAVKRLAAAVDRACRETGFLFIKAADLSEHDIGQLLALTRLFELPQEAKDALDATQSPLFRGYNSLQHGKHSCTPEDGQRDAKESFTLGMERAADDPRPASPMHGPNQWPPAQLLPDWREEAEAALGRLLGVARLLMRALALALRQPEDFFTSKCADPVAQLVLFRYPPTPAGPPARGCGEHTDCGFLTLVAQDAPGIEVRLPDGSWLAAPPIPGTLLVNLGDLAQRWTGDVYRSTEHRVVNRSPATTRHSLVFFCNCDFDALVETIAVPATAAAEDAGADAAGAAGAAGASGGAAGDGAAMAAGTAAAAGGVAAARSKAGDGGGPAVYPPIKAGEYILQRLGLMHV
ncbi:hypothetical protein ABPG75_014057 [Micractinium tetrahymenae]